MRIDAGETGVGNQTTPIFDGHLHIIDERFHLTVNAAYLPGPFTAESYLARVEPLGVVGGAVVSKMTHWSVTPSSRMASGFPDWQ
jgi:predicted TIM-barrel fold metal-dependent hydrolase